MLGLCYLVAASGKAMAQGEDPVRTAQRTGRPALIHFTGSDWCANCKAFDQDVLSRTEVKQFLQQRFVTYTADRPVRKKLDPATEQLNGSLMARYNAGHVFPMLVVVNAEGRVLDRITYDRSTTVDRYLERLGQWSSAAP